MPPLLPPPSPEEQTAIRRAVQKAKLPLVSGSGSVVVLVLCFVLSAAAVFLVGWTVHWPLWVDFEIMLLLWWLVWIVTLGLVRNRANTSSLRSQLRDLREAITKGDKAAAEQVYRKTVSALDKAIQKGTLHENTASRYKSRLSARVAAIK